MAEHVGGGVEREQWPVTRSDSSGMADVVRLTVVPSEGDSIVACALLRSEGIQCRYRRATFATVAAEVPGAGHWQEIMVFDDDLETARELLAADATGT